MTALDEAERIDALVALDILDTPPEQEYDELVQLASEICGTPIGLVSFVDSHRQWFKAAVGLEVKQTPRDIAFCAHAIRETEMFIVEDATADERFRENPLVTGDLNVRFYAGVPLEAPSGHSVGTLCVIDTVPRTLSSSQKNALEILGRQVKARMDLRQKQRLLEQANKINEGLLSNLRDRNNLFTEFMNNGPFISYIKDEAGRYVYLNDRHRCHFGVEGDAWIGLNDQQLWPAHIAEQLRSHDRRVLESGNPVELSEITASGTLEPTHWKSYKFPLRLENGDLMLAGMSIDVTEELNRKLQLERVIQEKLNLAASLESSQILMETFVNNNPNMCFFKSQQGTYLLYNSKFQNFFGVDKFSWIGKTDREVRPSEEAHLIEAQDAEVFEQSTVLENTVQMVGNRGTSAWYKSFKFPIQTADGSRILAGVAFDITLEIEKERALSEANAKLERLATTDLLTGLANRRVFEERIAIEFTNAIRKERSLALLVMDIDDFKKRNDTYGHAAGDTALSVLGKLALKTLRPGDLAARIGGEEFAFLLPETNAQQAAQIAVRFQQLLRETDPERLTVSVGIATLYPSMPHSPENWKRLLSLADAAMYAAKKSGKDRYVIHQA